MKNCTVKSLAVVRGLQHNTRKPTAAVQRHQMGYVEQFDTLVSTLSVRDMLLYTSELKRPMVRASPLRPANHPRLPSSLLRSPTAENGVKPRVRTRAAEVALVRL